LVKNEVVERSIDSEKIRIPLARMRITDREVEAVAEVVRSGWLIFGKNVAAFEEGFARLLGVKHAIAVNSGSSALLVSLQALGVRRDDEVIVPDMSFISTGTACMYLGAKPVFVDINLENYGIDPERIEEKITSQTKVLLPVHYWGHTAEMDRVNALAQEYGFKVLEDAAEAHLSTYRGEAMAGTLGDAAIFSFTPSKPMTTGEGGMITTNDDEIADRCRKIINFGDYDKFDHRILGFNFRMQDMNGALGRVQLQWLPDAIKVRRATGTFYSQALQDVPGVICPIPRTETDTNYQIYPLRIDLNALTCSKEEFIQEMLGCGVHCRTYYPAFHSQGVFGGIGGPGEYPNAELFEKSTFVLPIFPGLSDAEKNHIVDSVRNIANKYCG
jgi:dTDP-4-amino-4,6-dideoxygalactose transaminase